MVKLIVGTSLSFVEDQNNSQTNRNVPSLVEIFWKKKTDTRGNEAGKQ